jgi:PKHD-type hydroxylase
MTLRADLSATLFLTEPEEYDGGVLTIEGAYGAQEVKLPAGDLVIYPADSLHQVSPVTRGARVSSFFWIQSMVAEGPRRAILFDLDQSIQRLRAAGADRDEIVRLSGVYNNLLRLWAVV